MSKEMSNFHYYLANQYLPSLPSLADDHSIDVLNIGSVSHLSHVDISSLSMHY